MNRLTFVTCLYDLSKRGTNHRSIDWMFANSEFVLSLDHELVIFTEPELAAEIRKRRDGRPTRILPVPFETLLSRPRAAGALCGHRQSNTTSTKVTATYIQLMWAKYAMLESALTLTQPTHLAWIDVAITHVAKTIPGLAEEIFKQPSDLPQFHMLRYFDMTETIVPAYWYTLHGHLAGGLVVGEVGRMRDLIAAFWSAIDLAIANGLAPVDEAILSYLAAQQPDRYAFSYGDYCDILRNHDHVRGGLGHLLWQARDAKERGKLTHVATLKSVVGHAVQAHDLEECDPALNTLLFTEFLNVAPVAPQHKRTFKLSRVVSPGSNPAKPAIVPESADKPLLGLVMIVKNEAHGIVKTLESFKSVINTWTILDTGSTDGTQDLIQRTLDGIPGQIHEEPFIDFSASRNRALELHGDASIFTVMPDADDWIDNPSALGSFLTAHVNDNEPAFLLNLRRDQLDYWLPLVLRAKARWRYRGRVHECCGPQTGSRFASVRIEGTALRQAPPPQSAEASKRRWERDLKLLRDDFLADSKNERAVFYLAQTYECLGQPEQALALYERHLELGGWIEEQIEAAIRRAKILNAIYKSRSEADDLLKDLSNRNEQLTEAVNIIVIAQSVEDRETAKARFLKLQKERANLEARIATAQSLTRIARGHTWAEVQQAFLDAYQLDTRRAEPLFHIAEHWYDEEVHPLALLFSGRAERLAPVSSALFLDRNIYDYRAADIVAISSFYCDQLGDPTIRPEGRRCAEKAVRARPSDERLRANWAFYAPKVSEEFGARIQAVDFTPEAPYTASNPSVHFDGIRWRVLVRTTNYKIINGQYLTPNDNVIYTRNWMIELDHELATQRAIEMKDRTGLPTTSFPVHGYEDCRLFRHQGQLYASATVCDWTDQGDRELTIVKLDDDYQIIDAWPVRGSWSATPQKNWMPIEGDDLRFIYATKDPTTILTVNPSARQITTPAVLGHGRLRGGSQAVKIGDAWIFIVHDVAWPGGNARIYLHRFVEMDANFRVIGMSDPFYFERRGIEFCCGLGYDGKKLVASFSVEDRCAKLAIFDLEKVRSSLRRDYTI